MFTYKGYTGSVAIDFETGMLSGSILDLEDPITFEGKTVQSARQAFQDAVEGYLAYCRKSHEKPSKPWLSKRRIKVFPELGYVVEITDTKETEYGDTWHVQFRAWACMNKGLLYTESEINSEILKFSQDFRQRIAGEISLFGVYKISIESMAFSDREDARSLGFLLAKIYDFISQFLAQ